jgi:two-component system NarL family response regulator
MSIPSKNRKPSPGSSDSKPGAARNDSSTQTIRVLVADDHPTVLAGLVSIITMMPDMMVVGEASNGFEALELWRKNRPDVTLLDLRMPKMDGVGAIEEIRRLDGLARIIILTTFDTDNEIYRAFKAGAKGFLLKDARREELLECIRRVYRNEVCIPPEMMGKLTEAMSGETLTAREMGVLRLLALGKSNKEIGTTLFISETTVKGHLQHIFAKLHVLSRTEALAAASRRGLIEL